MDRLSRTQWTRQTGTEYWVSFLAHPRDEVTLREVGRQSTLWTRTAQESLDPKADRSGKRNTFFRGPTNKGYRSTTDEERVPHWTVPSLTGGRLFSPTEGPCTLGGSPKDTAFYKTGSGARVSLIPPREKQREWSVGVVEGTFPFLEVSGLTVEEGSSEVWRGGDGGAPGHTDTDTHTETPRLIYRHAPTQTSILRHTNTQLHTSTLAPSLLIILRRT